MNVKIWTRRRYWSERREDDEEEEEEEEERVKNKSEKEEWKRMSERSSDRLSKEKSFRNVRMESQQRTYNLLTRFVYEYDCLKAVWTDDDGFGNRWVGEDGGGVGAGTYGKTDRYWLRDLFDRQ